MGGMAMGKCEDGQKEYVNISKDDMEDYNLAIITHAMDFFKEHASLKKPIPKNFSLSLLNNLSIKDLLTLGNLLSTKFMNP
jgi:hypothetical protein